MIVLGISSLGVGGAQVWVKNLAHLVASEIDVEIVYGGFYGGIDPHECLELTKEFRVVNIPGLDVPFHPLAILRAYRYVRQRPAARVIASSFGAGANLRIAARLAGRPAFYISHGWSYRYQRKPLSWFSAAAESLLGRISTVVCISRADWTVAREHLRIPRRNLALVRNRLPARATPPRAPVSVGEGRLRRVLYVGRQAAPKRFDLYIQLAERFPDVEFHAVGPMASDFPVPPPGVVLHGRVPEFDRYGDFDLFCLLSDSEGLPMSALEAHCAGIPMLLSNVGGCPELIRGNGLLTGNTIEEIAAQFAQLTACFGRFASAAQAQRDRFAVTSPAVVRLVGRRPLPSGRMP